MQQYGNGIRLTTSAPINDGGRSLNYLYVIGGVVGVIAGIATAGIGFIFTVPFGLFAALLIKMKILEVKAQSELRKMRFYMNRMMPYDQLLQKLQPKLVPLGMQLEFGNDRITVLFKGVIYDVLYNEDGTFSIWWRLNLAQAFTKMRYITLYRKIVEAMGIIGYNIQLVSEAEEQTEVKSGAGVNIVKETEPAPQPQQQDQTETITCIKCSAKLPKTAKFCNICGMRVMEGNYCRGCGRSLPTSAQFCNYCGQKQ